MKKSIREKIEPREETKRILELAEEALGGAIEARKRIKLSIDAAKKCGRLLNQEKKFVTRELGRGYWLSYYEINFGKVLPLRTAQHWMRLEYAIAYSPTDELRDSSGPEKTENMSEANILRLGMLALDLFPKKTPLLIEGNAPAPKLSASYLAHLSWLEDWISEFNEQSLVTPPTAARIAQLKADFRKVIQFCQQLGAS